MKLNTLLWIQQYYSNIHTENCYTDVEFLYFSILVSVFIKAQSADIFDF